MQEADSKIKELEEKLQYYNVKLVGYNSPKFDSVVISKTNYYSDNKIYWLEKIEETEKKIISLKAIINNYECFVSGLSQQENLVMDFLIMRRYKVDQVVRIMNVSRSRVYDIKNAIINLGSHHL